MEIRFVKKDKNKNIDNSFLLIIKGIECGDRCDCDKRFKCKYAKSNARSKNFEMKLRDFFKYKLNIKIPPSPIFIMKDWKRLSGTNKCPFHKSRNYTCHGCKYCGGILYRDCLCEERNNTKVKERKEYVDNEWSNYSKCGYFEKLDCDYNYLKEN